MILGEAIFALVLCGILMGIAIHMFKTNDVAVTPYIYSVMKNLPEANKILAEESYQEGTSSRINELPDSTLEYCARLADLFVVSGEVNCSTTGSSTFTATIDNTKYGQNFKLTNGVSFYHMNPGSWDDSLENNFIDAFIDVNGSKNGANALGEDVFPIRIFKNGDVVPSYTSNMKSFEDEEFFAYKIVVNKGLNANNKISRVEETADARTTTEKTSGYPFRDKVSFKEGICISNPSLISEYYKNETCTGYTLIDQCNPSSESYPYISDKSAYCKLEPVKPSGSGIFKIFGI